MKAVINLARFFASHPLTHTAPIKAWQRWLSWQIKSRLRGEVIVPWIGGQLLAVRRGMTGATGNVYAGLHEFADMMFLLHFLRERDLFLDIGANVGAYTVLASGVCRAVTFAFEPDPDTVRALRRNIAVNSLEKLVTLHALALGDHEDDVPFRHSPTFAAPGAIVGLPLKARAYAGIGGKRHSRQESARISQIEIRERIGLEESTEGIVALIEQIPYQPKSLDILRDLV